MITFFSRSCRVTDFMISSTFEFANGCALQVTSSTNKGSTRAVNVAPILDIITVFQSICVISTYHTSLFVYLWENYYSTLPPALLWENYEELQQFRLKLHFAHTEDRGQSMPPRSPDPRTPGPPDPPAYLLLSTINLLEHYRNLYGKYELWYL